MILIGSPAGERLVSLLELYCIQNVPPLTSETQLSPTQANSGKRWKVKGKSFPLHLLFLESLELFVVVVVVVTVSINDARKQHKKPRRVFVFTLLSYQQHLVASALLNIVRYDEIMAHTEQRMKQ